MAESTQDFKELNKRAWNKEAVPKFELPEFKALSRLSVFKYLTIGSKGQSVSVSDQQVYSVDGINNSDVENKSIKAVGNATVLGNKVNTNIWSIFDKDDTKIREGPLEILDFACGPGNVTLALLASLPPERTYKITGIDLSEDLVNAYNKRVDSPNAHAEALDVLEENDVLGDRKFDIVVCTMSLHHIWDLELLCQRIGAHIKKDGWFFAMDFDTQSHFSEKEAIEKGVAHTTLGPEKISRLFENAGLSQIHVETGFEMEFSKEQIRKFEHRKAADSKDKHANCTGMKLCIVAGCR